MEFSFAEIDKDLYQVEKKYTVKKAGHGSDISGPYWMLIETDILKGKIWFQSDQKTKPPKGNHHFIFLPPFSWTMEYYAKNTEIKIRGLISKTKMEHPHFSGPILFYSQEKLPKSLKGVSEFLNKIEVPELISVSTEPSSLAQRAKNILDQEYHNGVEIGGIAARLKTPSAVLTRAFKSDYGQTPSYYRKGLRVTVGMYELMMGAPPAQAALLAGYSDLGRFYQQFKAYMHQTPAQYSKKSKNAKSSSRN